jgi:hypothetical protein
MGPVKKKVLGVDYRCQDCGLVVTIKTDIDNKTQHGELMCCNDIMKKTA